MIEESRLKERLYKEHMQKQYEEEQKREQERRDAYNQGMDLLHKKRYVRATEKIIGADGVRRRADWYRYLANERGYSDLPISDVVARCKVISKAIEDKDLEMDTLFSRVYNDAYSESQNEDYAGRFARDVFQGFCPKEYKEIRELYNKLDDELLELQIEAGAYDSCKQEYIKQNEDLINAEREKARRETLLSSGILEEMGIVTAKQETEESTPQEETFSSAIHNIVNGEG